MLTILEDYLDYKGWNYLRLDGSVKSSERQHSIDLFNQNIEKYFCFLISTKAGNLGINLSSADTVILYDFMFNPHVEKQAIDRTHRIGQEKKVVVYRLVTQNSLEEAILLRNKSKLVLEHLVVKKMQGINQNELNNIIKFGAEKIFKENEKDLDFKDFTEEEIEKLLNRNNFEENKTTDSLLGSYTLTRDTKENVNEDENKAFWDKIIEENKQIGKKKLN